MSGCWPSLKVGHRPLVHELPGPDHDHVVADLLDLGDQVAGYQDRSSRRRRTTGSGRASRRCPPGRGRSSARRGSAVRGRPAGPPRCPGAASCPASTSGTCRPRGPPSRCAPATAQSRRRELPEAGKRLQVVAPAELRVERRRLDERADLAAGSSPARSRLPPRIDAASRGRADEAEQHPDRRRLARPRSGPRTRTPSPRDGEVDAIHHGPVTKALRSPGVDTASDDWAALQSAVSPES